MKKIIITFFLMIFIIFTFGVTTSNAWITYNRNLYRDTPRIKYNGAADDDVTSSTDPDTMITAVTSGKYLTGISTKVRDKNLYLLCRERHWHLYGPGKYVNADGVRYEDGSDEDEEGNGSETTYPWDDKNDNGKIDGDETLEKDGYAAAYILAAPGYIKSDETYEDPKKDDERQWAWYLLKQYESGDSKNDLYLIAKDGYQEYKTNLEIDMTVTDDNANTQIIADNVIYGPIIAKYSYFSYAASKKSDEWGGFNYAFFDEKGSNISDKVQLCTLSNGKYESIANKDGVSKDETSGYYKVRTEEYNGTNLYLVTSDKSISEITIKMQENRVDYFATIYPMYGEFHRTEGNVTMCDTHESMVKNYTTDLATAITTGRLYRTGDAYPYKYYKYVKYERSTGSNTQNYAKIPDGNGGYTSIGLGSSTKITIDGITYPKVEAKKTIEGCKYCRTTACTGANIIYKHFDTENNIGDCLECGENFYGDYAGAIKHWKANHYTYEVVTARTVLSCYFEEFHGCAGAGGSDKTTGCGVYLPPGYYHSQGLYIIKSTETKQSNELKLETKLKLTKSVSVSKKWSDNSNTHGTRPTSVTVKLLADGKDTGKTVTLNSSNSWKGKFGDLPPVSASGEEIKYTVQEVKVTGYTTTIAGNQTDGFTITNKLQTVDVPVTKKWDDANNQDGKRTTSITAILKADGTQKQTVTLNASNNWTHSFTGLPKYNKNGTEIKYTVDEQTTPPGYTKTISGNTITNKHIPEVIDIPVTKVWDDANDQDGLRPESIAIALKADGTQKQTVTLNASNNWTHTFTNLPKYKNQGTEIVYTVDELTTPDGYTKTINGYTITNKHIPEVIDIPVTKVWNDNDNQDGLRPSSITITLYKDGSATKKTLTLNASNNWAGTFEDLPKNRDHGTEIKYTVKETGASELAYDKSTKGNQTTGYTLTNTLVTIDIPVTKIWNDINNRNLRPNSITVTLYENGTATTKTAQLSASNNWKYTFKDLPEYKNEKKVVYTVQETGVPTGDSEYISEVTGSQDTGYTITNTYYDGYIEITGRVWLDGQATKANDVNGKYGTEDENKKFDPEDEVIVRLLDSKGEAIESTYIYTNAKGDLVKSTECAKPNGNGGTYTIRVNYDNSNNVYKLYDNAKTVEQKVYGTKNSAGVYENYAYVEFEYDGMKYTTVKPNVGEDLTITSKAIENEDRRTGKNGIDTDPDYNPVTPSTLPPTAERITASTKNAIGSLKNSYKSTENRPETVRYCSGKGQYIETNQEKAWDKQTTGTCSNCGGKAHTLREYKVKVDKIPNVNLGLFEREQPDVAIYMDLSEVKLKMNDQEYIYKYNAISNQLPTDTTEKTKVKFEDKETFSYFTYKRPLNPADLAYIKKTGEDLMSVDVTYTIEVANLSTTLPVTVHSIINNFDLDYKLKNANGWDEINTDKAEHNGFKTAKYQTDIVLNSFGSHEMKLTYSVESKAIKKLLDQDATLNNAVEINSYSTKYGSSTLYAEMQTEGRTGNRYGGYDYDSHPGNAGIFINPEGRLDAIIMEDDTALAPSFVLCKETDEKGDILSKTISGTIWEDLDDNTEDGQRLGDGKYTSNEKTIQNVKIELYDINGNLAQVYKGQQNSKGEPIFIDAVAYTDADGKYALKGVVTGEYFMKFTYGDDESELGHEATKIKGIDVEVNARNYKSTIITDGKVKEVINKNYGDSNYDKTWHITHTEGYSVAVDNMLDRLKIEDLQYSNFNDDYIKPENMTAYTKPFETQIEFEVKGEAQIVVTEKELQNKVVEGNIKDEAEKDVTNELSKLDFGIAERPREDLFVQKTINSFRITLANGQELASGNPTAPNANMNYTKAIGFNQNIDSGEEARKALAKRLIVEMDAELIQGARLQVEYAVTVTNNNEIDYDYGVETDYTDIINNIAQGENDKYITRSSKANYYYYGNHDGLDEMKTTIEFVDYIDYELGETLDATDWKIVNSGDLAGLICDGAEKALKNNKYIPLQSTSGASVTLARGEHFGHNMSASKTISNKDENVFDNNAEILKIDAKTARTIQEIDGEVTVKSYKPGDYVPSAYNEATQQDDDKVDLIITPPTGITKYIIPYILIGAVGLMVIGIGIIFIKKKILEK